MTDGIIEYTPSNVWMYIEENICSECRRPHEIYTNSCVRDSNWCVYCITNSAERRTWNYDTDEQLAKNKRELAHLKDTRPAISRDTCSSCCGIFPTDHVGTRWEKISAKDSNGTETYAHADCTKECGECDNTYLTWNNRSPYRNMQFSEVQGESMCDTCTEVRIQEDNLFLCPSCDRYESSDWSHTYDGEEYCESCYDNNVWTCDECNEQVWSGNDHDCDPTSGLVHSYGYKPRPHFFGNDTYHMGFELEVESRGNSLREGASIIVNALGERVYLKQDGSLDEGFEIVTHPHSLAEYHANFEWSALDLLRREGYRSWNTGTCGIHVHVSRTAFDSYDNRTDILKRQAHELRFMKLIYDNERQISRLAGRKSSYAEFTEKGNLVSKVKYGNSDGRYAAVNCENSDTLEIRVFRGSLKPKRVLSALELVHASVEYTRDLKVSATNKALSWMKFTHFIVEHMDKYPNLADVLEETFAKDEAISNDYDN